MTDSPYEYLDLPAARSVTKPRRTGLTMMIDMGLSPMLLADQLRLVGPYVDKAKIFVGSARLYPVDLLREKAEIYARHGITMFIGGQFLEYVVFHDGLDAAGRFFTEARRLGIRDIEVSDNCIDLTDDARRGLIRSALDAGLRAHGEVGSKDHKTDIDDLLRQAHTCLEAGCDLVLFEAAELVETGAVDAAGIEAIKNNVPPENLMIELPGTWIDGITQNHVFDMMKSTLRVFGPDANLGNVMWDQVLNLETHRCGLGIAGPGHVPRH